MVKPISQLGPDLTRRVDRIEHAIVHGDREMLTAGAQAAKQVQLDVMRADAGGDLRLSRVRSGRGASIGVKYDIRPNSATVKAVGPVPLIANTTVAHRIPRTATGRAARRKRLAFAGGVFSAANHPGTKGKDTWNRGRDKAQPQITKAIGRKSDDIVRRAFKAG